MSQVGIVTLKSLLWCNRMILSDIKNFCELGMTSS